jgi:hypothetical protein
VAWICGFCRYLTRFNISHTFVGLSLGQVVLGRDLNSLLYSLELPSESYTDRDMKFLPKFCMDQCLLSDACEAVCQVADILD